MKKLLGKFLFSNRGIPKHFLRLFLKLHSLPIMASLSVNLQSGPVLGGVGSSSQNSSTSTNKVVMNSSISTMISTLRDFSESRLKG